MQRDQQAYDRGVTVFSPDGRLYQVEYAREAVKRGSPTVGVRTAESVVLATLGQTRSPLMEADSIEKLHDLDGQLGVASAGHVADARRLVDYGRQYAQRERLRYGEAPDAEVVATAIADFIQETTQTGGTRPFGTALLVGGMTDSGPQLYQIDPSGTPDGWRAAAIGDGSEAIRSRLEAEHEPGLDREAGVSLALRALVSDRDQDPTAEELDLAVLDAEGFDAFDRERTANAMADAGIGPGS